jgi:hypothetical protein
LRRKSRPLASCASCIKLPIQVIGPEAVWRRSRRVIPWYWPGKSISTHRTCVVSRSNPFSSVTLAGAVFFPVASWKTISLYGTHTVSHATPAKLAVS